MEVISDQLNQHYVISALAVVGVVSFVTYLFKRNIKRQERPINPNIRKEEKKVRDVLDIEDVVNMVNSKGKVSLCRCWRSQKWPYCDSAHSEFNKCSGDNVGPINIVQKKEAKS